MKEYHCEQELTRDLLIEYITIRNKLEKTILAYPKDEDLTLIPHYIECITKLKNWALKFNEDISDILNIETRTNLNLSEDQRSIVYQALQLEYIAATICPTNEFSDLLYNISTQKELSKNSIAKNSVELNKLISNMTEQDIYGKAMCMLYHAILTKDITLEQKQKSFDSAIYLFKESLERKDAPSAVILGMINYAGFDLNKPELYFKKGAELNDLLAESYLCDYKLEDFSKKKPTTTFDEQAHQAIRIHQYMSNRGIARSQNITINAAEQLGLSTLSNRIKLLNINNYLSDMIFSKLLPLNKTDPELIEHYACFYELLGIKLLPSSIKKLYTDLSYDSSMLIAKQKDPLLLSSSSFDSIIKTALSEEHVKENNFKLTPNKITLLAYRQYSLAQITEDRLFGVKYSITMSLLNCINFGYKPNSNMCNVKRARDSFEYLEIANNECNRPLNDLQDKGKTTLDDLKENILLTMCKMAEFLPGTCTSNIKTEDLSFLCNTRNIKKHFIVSVYQVRLKKQVPHEKHENILEPELAPTGRKKPALLQWNIYAALREKSNTVLHYNQKSSLKI